MYEGILSERSSDIESIMGKNLRAKEGLMMSSMTSDMLNSYSMREGNNGDSLIFGGGGFILKNNMIPLPESLDQSLVIDEDYLRQFNDNSNFKLFKVKEDFRAEEKRHLSISRG
jgi:hypothetical protein